MIQNIYPVSTPNLGQIKSYSEKEKAWRERETLAEVFIRESIQRIEGYQGRSPELFHRENKHLGMLLKSRNHCRVQAEEARIRKDYLEFLFI